MARKTGARERENEHEDAIRNARSCSLLAREMASFVILYSDRTTVPIGIYLIRRFSFAEGSNFYRRYALEIVSADLREGDVLRVACGRDAQGVLSPRSLRATR